MKNIIQIIVLLMIVSNGLFLLQVSQGRADTGKVVSITIAVYPVVNMYTNQSQDMVLNLGVTYNITFIPAKGKIHDFNIAPVDKYVSSPNNHAIFTLGVNKNGTIYPDTGLWTPPEAGWYMYYCSYHVVAGMRGWIKVGDAGKKPSAPLPGFSSIEVLLGFCTLSILVITYRRKNDKKN